jgi:hypothetical protein
MDEEQEWAQPEAPADGDSLASRGCGLIGCVLILGVLVAIGAGIYFAGNALEPLADKYLWAPHDVVREYLTAYEDGKVERARQFVCDSAKAGRLPDPSAPVGGPGAWSAGVDDTFPYPRAGGRWAIYYVVRSSLGEDRAQALLEREEDGWRICEFVDG